MTMPFSKNEMVFCGGGVLRYFRDTAIFFYRSLSLTILSEISILEAILWRMSVLAFVFRSGD